MVLVVSLWGFERIMFIVGEKSGIMDLFWLNMVMDVVLRVSGLVIYGVDFCLI